MSPWLVFDGAPTTAQCTASIDWAPLKQGTTRWNTADTVQPSPVLVLPTSSLAAVAPTPPSPKRTAAEELGRAAKRPRGEEPEVGDAKGLLVERQEGDGEVEEGQGNCSMVPEPLDRTQPRTPRWTQRSVRPTSTQGEVNMYDTQASSCASSMGAPPNFPWVTTNLVSLLNIRSAFQAGKKKYLSVSILVVLKEKKPPRGNRNLEEWIVEDDSGGSLKVKRWDVDPDDELSGCVRVGDVLHLQDVRLSEYLDRIEGTLNGESLAQVCYHTHPTDDEEEYNFHPDFAEYQPQARVVLSLAQWWESRHPPRRFLL